MTDEVINTVEAPSEFDALVKLRPGEPYFAMIGRDRYAPVLLNQWADNNRRRAYLDFEAGKINDEKLEAELRQSTQAEMIAWAMQEYKAGYVEPDAPPAVAPVYYSGNILPAETAARDEAVKAQAGAARKLHNCIAELAEAAKMIEGLGFGEDEGELNYMVEKLKIRAANITPARPIPAQAGV